MIDKNKFGKKGAQPIKRYPDKEKEEKTKQNNNNNNNNKQKQTNQGAVPRKTDNFILELNAMFS